MNVGNVWNLDEIRDTFSTGRLLFGESGSFRPCDPGLALLGIHLVGSLGNSTCPKGLKKEDYDEEAEFDRGE